MSLPSRSLLLEEKECEIDFRWHTQFKVMSDVDRPFERMADVGLSLSGKVHMVCWICMVCNDYSMMCNDYSWYVMTIHDV